MENRWKHFKTVYDGDYCELEGVNIWDNKWETDYKTVTVEDPLYNEKKQFNIYWIDTPTRRIEFVAGEFSNCVWGFYTKSKIDIREKTTSAKKPTYLTVKDHSVSGEEFQLLHNEALGMLETFPQPQGEKLSEYYKSEDYISHTDAKRNLFEKVYHLVRTISLKRKLKLINSFQSKEKTLLDIGCGTGDFLEIAKNNSWDVVGVEPNEQARTIANSKTKGSVFDIQHLETLDKNSFDVITLWHVLEHLPDLKMHVKLFKRLLKRNGTLVIAVPNFKSYDAQYYKNFWAAYDVPRHLWHFSKTAIEKLFHEEQLKLVKTLPMKFDAYYVSLLSEKYKSGFMNPIKAFWIGWRSNLKGNHTKEYSSHIYILKSKNI